jgi:hypothetical protein
MARFAAHSVLLNVFVQRMRSKMAIISSSYQHLHCGFYAVMALSCSRDNPVDMTMGSLLDGRG